MGSLVSAKEETIISVNFYEALSELNLDFEGANIEFIAQWSPVVKNTTCLENRIVLSHDYYKPIESIISKLKEEKNKSTKIMGRIKKLESSPDVEKRTMGKVKLVYLDESNKRKTVTANLEKNDYDNAIVAHTQGKHIEIVCELVSSHNTIIKCDSFSIIN